MADIYREFSVKYKPPTNVITDFELSTLCEELSKDENDYRIVEYKIEKDGIWIRSGDYGDVDATILFIQALQKHFNDSEPFLITWSISCSAPRINEFGGGGAVFTKDKLRYIDTWEWCNKEIKKLKWRKQ